MLTHTCTPVCEYKVTHTMSILGGQSRRVGSVFLPLRGPVDHTQVVGLFGKHSSPTLIFRSQIPDDAGVGVG